MADSVLNKVLKGEITTSNLFEWLNKCKNEDGKFSCSQGEFLSHFLNFIHDKAPCFDKTSDTPRKVHTPKSIRKIQFSKSETKPKRTNLFPEPNHNINDSLAELEARIENKHLLHDLNSSREANVTNPLSPIYARPNTSTPRPKYRDDKSVSLGDFITYAKKSGSKSHRNAAENVEPLESERKKSRRINPTNLNKKFNNGFQFNSTENSYNFNDSNTEIVATNNIDQRNMLVAEKLKISSRKLDDSQSKVINKITPHIKGGKEILPDVNLVTCKQKLDYLIEIYVHLLNNNFVLNITSEIYFLLSLALTKQYESDVNNELEENENRIFTNVHNTYYFATKVLEAQCSILMVLNKPCVRLLCSNERLKFLYNKLDFNVGTLLEKGESPVKVVEKDSQVCFMSETDNRDNFPSDRSFHAFRKQRDLFYEILRIWEQNRFQDGWDFGIGLGGKIKMLFSLCGDAANLRHFCRLFKQQLLATCSNTNEEGLSDNQLPFLSSIPNINSEKLNRLKSRLVTKSSTNGINALPTFPGYQEFYREFIEIAAMHTFNVHLRNALIQHILDLNDSKFSSNELDEQDTSVDLDTKTAYLNCIKSLRLLAKFLGFIDSTPYRKQNNIPDKVLTAEINVRIWEQPVFDLNQIISQSYTKNTLIITIPWLTKYLSMLDYVTLRLAYFEAIYDILFEIFYSTPDKKRTMGSNMLIKLTLGWLFELPHFPSELYFSWCTKRLSGWKLKLVRDEVSLDLLDIVDKDIIYACCPYLNEFKMLLQYNCAKNGTISVKHITPVSAVESPVQINEKRLKLQLEDAFFTGHPTSMRKTVEFVSERVASACVKTICNNIVPQNKSEVLSKLNNEFKELVQNKSITPKVEAGLRTKFNEFIHENLFLLLAVCKEELNKQISLKICDSINLLLSDEEMQQTKDTCSAIAARMCRDKVLLWLNTHINEGVYNKDFESEFTKILGGNEKLYKPKMLFNLPTLGSKVEHNCDTLSPADTVDHIRTIMRELIEDSTNIDAIKVIELLDSVQKTLKERCDINECILSLIKKMLLDLIIIIIAHKFEICTKVLYNHFTSFWDEGIETNEFFKMIISPRNIAILNQSKDHRKSWNRFSDFILMLLEKKMLDCEEFEEECVAIFRQNWNQDVLKLLSTCFQNIADEFNKQSYNHSKFTVLMSFLSDFCSDMDAELGF